MTDPEECAEEAGLVYVSDEEPGIKRLRKGKGFTYKSPRSQTIKNPKVIERIKKLVVPPAWKDVWICQEPEGHLQVTGRDARNRKQYRYHEKWNLFRNSNKFDRMIAFAEKLPELRKKIEEDLKLSGLPSEKILAAVIKTMLITQSRIGNATYAEENDSYGLTTIKNDHVDVKGTKIHLSFRGKSGVEHDINFQDPTISRIIKRCQDLPGEELFAYVDDEENAVDITSTHVNSYLKNMTGEDFTAKDLRTWGGSCKAIEVLVEMPEAIELSESKWKTRHVEIVRATAEYLHNTMAVCRKYYIHPLILQADRDGKLMTLWKSCRESLKYSRAEKLLIKILTP